MVKPRLMPCPIELTNRLVGGKWKLLIMRELFRGGIKRYGQLKVSVVGISDRTLSAQLRQLEEDGIVERRAYAEVPPRVEYSLTETGRSLRGVLSSIHEWGTEQIRKGRR